MRIYLATILNGIPDKYLKKIVTEGKPKYLLSTFFDGERICKRMLDIVKNTDNFLLDSGAFSFMSGAECSEKIIEEYAERYIDFIKRYKITRYFEIDVDTIFGLPYAEKIRHILESQTGIQSIPVWHKNRGIEYWKRMCQEYSYIAIGGLVFHVKQQEWPLIHKMVNYAAYKGVKVHGLGFTKTKILEDWNWYSVDSSSWHTSAVRGSQKHTFNGKHIETKTLMQKGVKYDQKLLATHNGIEWCKYQRYMELRKGLYGND